jgi:hypothetical protein
MVAPGMELPRATGGRWARRLGVAALLVARAGSGWAQEAAPVGPADIPCGSTERIEAGPRQRFWLEKRKAKCAEIEPYRGTFLERQILAFEKAERPSIFQLNLLGFYPRLLAVDHRSQTALGVRLWRPDLGSSRFDLAGNAFWSLQGFRYYEAQAGLIPHQDAAFPLFAPKTDEVFELPNVRWDMAVPYMAYASFTHRYAPKYDFFGIGPGSKREDHADFLLRDTLYEGVLGRRFERNFTVAGRAGYYDVEVGRGRDDELPDVTDVFSSTEIPGFGGRSPAFLRYGASLIFDSRDVWDNPHRGVVLAGEWLRYHVHRGEATSFDRLAADVRFYVPLGHQQRILALRAYASKDYPDVAGHRVPFYLLRFLGSSHTLRAFDSQRFRGEKLALLQAEYRWEASPALELCAFVDAGAVATETGDDLGRWVRDVGFGLRVKSHEATALRLDFAWGDEGKKLLFRFSPSY